MLLRQRKRHSGGKQVAFAYTARHQLDTVVVDSATLADYTYSPAGAVTGKTLGNGIVMSETLDSLYRVTGREYRKDGNLRVGFGYAYDAVGNPSYQEALHATGRSELYGYDGVYRLILASFPIRSP